MTFKIFNTFGTLIVRTHKSYASDEKSYILEFKRGHTLFAFKFVVGIIEFRGAKVINASSFRRNVCSMGMNSLFSCYLCFCNTYKSFQFNESSSEILYLSTLEFSGNEFM